MTIITKLILLLLACLTVLLFILSILALIDGIAEKTMDRNEPSVIGKAHIYPAKDGVGACVSFDSTPQGQHIQENIKHSDAFSFSFCQGQAQESQNDDEEEVEESPKDCDEHPKAETVHNICLKGCYICSHVIVLLVIVLFTVIVGISVLS